MLMHEVYDQSERGAPPGVVPLAHASNSVRRPGKAGLVFGWTRLITGTSTAMRSARSANPLARAHATSSTDVVTCSGRSVGFEPADAAPRHSWLARVQSPRHWLQALALRAISSQWKRTRSTKPSASAV